MTCLVDGEGHDATGTIFKRECGVPKIAVREALYLRE